jgi:polysaccharide pyruvyl transferase WcaK-like protein
MGEIAKTDVVVATRFHTVVSALMLGRPVISIGYAQKNDDLMADAGLGGFCQGIEALDLDGLIRQFTEMTAGLSHWQRRIAEIPSRYRMQLRHQESILAACILSPRPASPRRLPAMTASHKDGG